MWFDVRNVRRSDGACRNAPLGSMGRKQGRVGAVAGRPTSKSPKRFPRGASLVPGSGGQDTGSPAGPILACRAGGSWSRTRGQSKGGKWPAPCMPGAQRPVPTGITAHPRTLRRVLTQLCRFSAEPGGQDSACDSTALPRIPSSGRCRSFDEPGKGKNCLRLDHGHKSAAPNERF